MSIVVQTSAARAVARGERFEGAIDSALLPRLAEFQPQPQVLVDLQARQDVGGQGWLEGKVSVDVRLECRSCQKRFPKGVELKLQLALVSSEEDEERLLEQAEPYLVSQDQLMLHELVEDEILLSLPMLPQCPACENARPGEEAKVESTRPSPLAALKNLSLKGQNPAPRK